MKQYLYIFFICLLCAGNSANAQNIAAFNLNKHNGLPSNHVYGMITDRNGYLWISTDKGVVKYNGYECRTFNTSDGLATDDIWNLIEDLRGRIWLGCIAGEMGYIYNDNYYKANLKNINGTIFPSSLRRCDSGIIFCSPHLNGNPMQTLCIGGNHDTIYGVSFTDKRLKLPDTLKPPGNVSINEENELSHMYCHHIHHRVRNVNKVLDDTSKVQTYVHIMSGTQEQIDQVKNYVCIHVGKYLFNFNTEWKSSVMIVRSPSTKYDSLDIRKYGINEDIVYFGYNNTIGKEKLFYIYTRKHILTFEVKDSIRFVDIYTMPYQNTKNVNEIAPTSYIKNGMWNATVGTSTNGVYVPDNSEKFKLNPVDLTGYKNIGKIKDSISIWWNGRLRNILFLEKDKIIKSKELDISSHILSAVPLNADTLILTGSLSYYFYLRNDVAVEVANYSNIRGFALSNNGHYYAIDRSKFFSIYKYFNDVRYDSSLHTIDIDRFNNLTYDSVTNLCWAYADNKIVIYKKNKKKIYSKYELLGKNADNIESISIDRNFGNVIIKTVSQVYCIDPDNMKSKLMSCNINLKGASICMYKNLLVLSGVFGVAFCKIEGRGKFSKPFIFYNTRKIFYNEITGWAAIDGSLILSTDIATYKIHIPTESEYSKINMLQKNDFQHHVIVYSNNYIRKYEPGNVDTIDQVSRSLSLDIINPIGNGKLVYYYRFSDTDQWQRITTGEIAIPQIFKADNTYPLQVFFMDDAWKSDVITLSVYVKPYWWQTKSMRVVLWTTGALLALLVIVSVVLITRRQVLRANEKKNMQMELELKAIYAQINPHFIFNTLTSALLLISRNRMDDAYMHISKFSKLLRSYLKSSRNKYVTIEEEIDNLKNYTELQQTRFKDRFQCEIITDPGMAISNIKIPSLLIQPFVENAINHGLVQSNETGNLIIEFRYKEAAKKVICIISDNGIGRQQAKKNKKNSENTIGSYGNILIKDLVDIFNRYEKMHIDIRYVDKASPETGTSVIITITNPVIE